MKIKTVTKRPIIPLCLILLAIPWLFEKNALSARRPLDCTTPLLWLTNGQVDYLAVFWRLERAKGGNQEIWLTLDSFTSLFNYQRSLMGETHLGKEGIGWQLRRLASKGYLERRGDKGYYEYRVKVHPPDLMATFNRVFNAKMRVGKRRSSSASNLRGNSLPTILDLEILAVLTRHRNAAQGIYTGEIARKINDNREKRGLGEPNVLVPSLINVLRTLETEGYVRREGSPGNYRYVPLRSAGAITSFIEQIFQTSSR